MKKTEAEKQRERRKAKAWRVRDALEIGTYRVRLPRRLVQAYQPDLGLAPGSEAAREALVEALSSLLEPVLVARVTGNSALTTNTSKSHK